MWCVSGVRCEQENLVKLYRLLFVILTLTDTYMPTCTYTEFGVSKVSVLIHIQVYVPLIKPSDMVTASACQ